MQADDFSAWEARTARLLEFFPGLQAKFLAPEAIALEKLRWYDAGRRKSDRQWNDVLRLIESQAEAFDRSAFTQWAQTLRLAELAAEAISESQV